jgi:pimeloyl-ACP methyl ester carboxylesterase
MIRRLRCNNRLPLIAILIALWAALFPGMSRAQAPATYGANAISGKLVIIRMEHISVHVTGKGSPVILIPGLSSPREVWDGVRSQLADSHTVYAVQVNGFGGDDPRANLAPGVIDGLVADLHKLIVTEKLKKPAVVGHSLGGLATLMLAKAHPQDVGKAMIVDALPFVGSAFFPGSTPESVKPQAEAMRAQMAGLHGNPVPDAILSAIAAQNALKPESRETVKGWMAKTDMRVSAQAMYEDMMVDLRGQLGGIAAPVTVLVPWTAARGEEAVLGFYRSEYAGTFKLDVRGVGDSGHFIMLDQPEAFRAALNVFLAG